MTTNTAGSVARDYGKQMIHYLRKDFTFANNGQALTIGTVPDGALVLRALSGVQVNVAFNAGTANIADMGTTANDDLYGTDLALGSIAFVPLDEAVSYLVSGDTTFTITPALSGTAATAGSGVAVIAYILIN